MPTPPTKRKLKTSTPAYQGETAEPTVKPTPIPSDGEMDQVLAETPSPTYKMPSLSPASSGNGLVKGGTEAVAAYQRKLNSMGANLKVDGAWGKNTQAAFDQFQGKAAPKATIRKAVKEASKPAMEVSSTSRTPDSRAKEVQLQKQGIPTIGDPLPYEAGAKAQDMEFGKRGMDTRDWYDAYQTPETTSPSGQKTKRVKGYQLYPNGRVKTPGGTMRNGTTLPKRKLTGLGEGARLAMY